MRSTVSCLVLIFFSLVYFSPLSVTASTTAPKSVETDGTNAIIIASFGTTVPSAITSIVNIVQRTRAAYPYTRIVPIFTSNIIRSIWRERQQDPQRWLDQGVPEEILFGKNLISTVGDLREEGYRNIIVQPSHMFYMEQAQDLQSYVDGLAAIQTTKKKWNPFDTIVMGRPALGMPGDRYGYHHDVTVAVKTLAADAERAKKEGALLLYMGHGNEHWSTGIYAETQKMMRKAYPEAQTFIGVVEGMPGLDDLLPAIHNSGNKKIILKPFMIVAGDHATNDMAGNGENSWKSILEGKGYQVIPVMEGLGSNDAFADIFISHIADIARDNGITLQ